MSHTGRWRADGLAVLFLGILAVAAYGRLLDPGLMLVDYDALVYFYPLRAYAAAAVLEGRLPLWNASSFAGAPFLANPQTALFYPPTALFFWLAVPYAYSLNLILHAFLAGALFHGFGRLSLSARPIAATAGAAIYMLGGPLSGQYGHLNQLSAAAWLPLILLLGQQAIVRNSRRLALAGGCVFAVQLLAGHPQQSYMTLAALGLVGLWSGWPAGWRGLARTVGLLGLLALSGLALAAIQLAPTAELARASIRGSGIDYRDAVAGSLWPWLVARALLPSFQNDLGSTEYLGYIGVSGLLLAGLALGAADRRRVALGLLLLVPGLALALGGANPLYPLLYERLPGFASFRVPARWLLLYTLGAACLATTGLDWLLARTGRPSRSQLLRLALTGLGLVLLWGLVYLGGVRATRQLQAVWLLVGLATLALAAGIRVARLRAVAVVGLLALLGAELWAAGGDLPPRRPVPTEVYAQPRDSTLYLQSRLGADRFLSIASEAYELKESPDYREWLADLPEQALLDFLVAAKRNEILTPNLHLLYGIDSLDGYDGGLLPLGRFLRLSGALIPPERVRPDGVLISRLDSLPARPLMDLLNLRIVLDGRSRDHERDGVQYDRSVLVELGPGETRSIERVPARAYDAVGLIAAYDGPPLPEGSQVGYLTVVGQDGQEAARPLRLGRETGPTGPEPGWQPPAGLQIVRPDSSTRDADPVEYLARVALPPVELRAIRWTSTAATGRLRLRAATLIDDRQGTFTDLVLDDRLERTRFFDMKVYEYPDVLPRAYLVGDVQALEDEQAVARLRSGAFDPRRMALLEPGAEPMLGGSPVHGQVEVLERRPERWRLRISSDRPALLVISDAYYPGWSASVDGVETSVLRANVAFKAVVVPAGEHLVELTYDPASFKLGLAVSGLAALVVVLARVWRRR